MICTGHAPGDDLEVARGGAAAAVERGAGRRAWPVVLLRCRRRLVCLLPLRTPLLAPRRHGLPLLHRLLRQRQPGIELASGGGCRGGAPPARRPARVVPRIPLGVAGGRRRLAGRGRGRGRCCRRRRGGLGRACRLRPSACQLPLSFRARGGALGRDGCRHGTGCRLGLAGAGLWNAGRQRRAERPPSLLGFLACGLGGGRRRRGLLATRLALVLQAGQQCSLRMQRNISVSTQAS